MMTDQNRPRGFLFVLAFVAVFVAGYIVNETSDATATPSLAFSANGVIRSTDGGFQFPDGTIQATASGDLSSIHDVLAAVQRQSVNQGRYDNRIADVTHDRSFVEICFQGGMLGIDENDVDMGTAGGDCEPGDVGWIIERDERPAANWTEAKATCLLSGMRLPEVFEYQLTCDNAPTIGIVDMTDNYEWASNQVLLQAIEHVDQWYLAVPVLGNAGYCGGGSFRACAG